jgi:hypothetical protein
MSLKNWAFVLCALGASSAAQAASIFGTTCTLTATTPGAQAQVTAGDLGFSILGANVSFNFFDGAGQLVSTGLQPIGGTSLPARSTVSIPYNAAAPAGAASCSITFADLIATYGTTSGVGHYTQCFVRGQGFSIAVNATRTGLMTSGFGSFQAYFFLSDGQIVSRYSPQAEDRHRLDPAFWVRVASGTLTGFETGDGCIAVPQGQAIVPEVSPSRISASCQIRRGAAYMTFVNRGSLDVTLSGRARVTWYNASGRNIGAATPLVDTRLPDGSSREVFATSNVPQLATSCKVDQNSIQGLVGPG